MDLKRILVALNSPNGRDAAFARALSLARASGAELYLLHAVPVNHRFSFRAAERLERMADLRQRAVDAGVRVQTVEQHGDAAETIELHANAREVDLIVMGGEARRGWRRTRSSVAESVIRRTKVPTLVVASQLPDLSTRQRREREEQRLRRILTLVDFSIASAGALRTAVDLARRHGARITLVHALKNLPQHMVFSGSEAWKMVQRLPARTAAVAERLRRKAAFFGAHDVDTEVATGLTGGVILEIATRRDADLIVMGTATRSWFDRVLFGSTTRRVLRRATVPVLVVPVVA
jgi:nucleotide-binding universal stress UspA family protein